MDRKFTFLSLAGISILSALGFISFGAATHHANVVAGDMDQDALVLPNGWKISPVGKLSPLGGDMPTKVAWLPGGKEAVILTSGFNNTGLSLVDAQTGEFQKRVVLPQAWCGLALSTDQTKLFVSEGGVGIAAYGIVDGKLGSRIQMPEKTLPKGFWVAGLQALPGNQLAAVDMNHGELNLLDGDSLAVQKKVKVGKNPFSVIRLKTGDLAVSNEGSASISLIDPASATVKATVKVGLHPTELIELQDGRIAVANAGSNSVSIVAGTRVVETIKTSLEPRDRVGSTPIALTQSLDGHQLFVANADNNDVAVVELGHGGPSKVTGFIPTGWYPSLVAVNQAGQLWIGSGKGVKFGPNVDGKVVKLANGHIQSRYIGSMLAGNLSVLSIPTPAELKDYTAMVFRNSPDYGRPVYTQREINDAQRKVLSKIKHVIYIIRENRTYDQVFGDMPNANGDPQLVMFGNDVTPNAHKIANEFVLLDNTYCNGEVSQDGHEWCNAAYCTEFTEKAWISSYSNRSQPEGDRDVDASPAGFLWDNCRTHRKSYMAYGEAAGFKSDPNTAPVFEGDPGLAGHASLAWSQEKSGWRDYQRMPIFLDDLKKAETTGEWPNFMVMSLGEDHTQGYAKGRYKPEASVASNDYALGELVQAVSHSRFWKDTAIFVIEDDAQNGPDHVDAHRTVALFISPYTKRHAVDSTMYTTASLVRTMELALGLPPMTQYDQGATPMLASLTDKPDFTPYSMVDETVDINAMNDGNTALSRASEKLDFSAYDRADPDKLNAILWLGRKGNAEMPAPVRSAIIRR